MGMVSVMAQPPDTIMVIGGGLDSGQLCRLWWQQEPLDISTDLNYGRTTDSDMILSGSPGRDVTMVVAQAVQIPIRMALKQCGPWTLHHHPRQCSRLQASAYPPPEVTGTIDIKDSSEP